MCVLLSMLSLGTLVQSGAVTFNVCIQTERGMASIFVKKGCTLHVQRIARIICDFAHRESGRKRGMCHLRAN